jgi:hypothetical protein
VQVSYSIHGLPFGPRALHGGSCLLSSWGTSSTTRPEGLVCLIDLASILRRQFHPTERGIEYSRLYNTTALDQAGLATLEGWKRRAVKLTIYKSLMAIV